MCNNCSVEVTFVWLPSLGLLQKGSWEISHKFTDMFLEIAFHPKKYPVQVNDANYQPQNAYVCACKPTTALNEWHIDSLALKCSGVSVKQILSLKRCIKRMI